MRDQKWREDVGGVRLSVVAHAFNPSTWETEAGRLLISRPAWTRVNSRTARVTCLERNQPNNQTNKQKQKQTKKRERNSNHHPIFDHFVPTHTTFIL